MEKYKTTETVSIKRSQINFAAYNPKKHKPEQVEKVRANIERVAFFGGIVWNVETGNLVDGHKRIMSLDILNGYTGKKSQDYDVKVESCNLDLRAEKEQNVFFDKSRTAIDNAMLAEMLNDINPTNAGVTDYGLPIDTGGGIPIDNGFKVEIPKEKDNSKSTVQAAGDVIPAPKQKNTQAVYLTINFINQNQKSEFMDAIGAERFICLLQGEELAQVIDTKK